MKYCKECQFENNDSTSFCYECGYTKFASTLDEATIKPLPSTPVDEVVANEPSSDNIEVAALDVEVAAAINGDSRSIDLSHNKESEEKSTDIFHDNYAHNKEVVVTALADLSAFSHNFTCMGKILQGIKDFNYDIDDSFPGVDDFIIEDTVLTSYSGCDNLVIVPRGVTVIGYDAFSGNNYVRFVSLPSTVTELDENAFAECENLVTVFMTDAVQTIGESAFSGCYSLTELWIPPAVSIIQPNTFLGCSALEVVYVPDSVTEIASSAYKNCSDLMLIYLGNSVQSIGEYAFSGCTSLNSVFAGNELALIEEGAFNECPLQNLVILSDSVTIMANAFDSEYATPRIADIMNVEMPVGNISIIELVDNSDNEDECEDENNDDEDCDDEDCE